MKITTSIILTLALTVGSYSAVYGAPSSTNAQAQQIKKAAELRKQKLRIQNERKKRLQRLRLQKLRVQMRRDQRLKMQKEREKARIENEKKKNDDYRARSCASSGSGKQSTGPACGRPTTVNRPKP